MNYHSLSGFFPKLSETEFELLVEDIKKHGQLEPIVLYGGEILDGRHRYEACKQLGIKPKTRSLNSGVEPKDYVIATNMRRRHLTPAQKNMVLIDAGLLKAGQIGRPEKNIAPAILSYEEAAKVTGTSWFTVQRVVTAAQDPELAARMRMHDTEESEDGQSQMSASEASREYRWRHGTKLHKDPYKESPDVGMIMRVLNELRRKPNEWMESLAQGKIDVLGHSPLIINRTNETISNLAKFRDSLSEASKNV